MPKPRKRIRIYNTKTRKQYREKLLNRTRKRGQIKGLYKPKHKL